MKTEEIELRKMELVLAREPGKDLMERISKKIEELLGHGISLEIKVDKSILGGAMVFFEGRYYNGSLKKKLDDFFSDKTTNK